MDFIKQSSKYNLVALGEIMLRLSSADCRMLSQSDVFRKHIGGSELNVISSSARLGGISAAMLTKVPENTLGRMVAETIRGGSVSDEYVVYDSSPARRLGLYYYENGAYPRKSSVVYDRAGSSVCSLSANEISEDIYSQTGIFHISSITLALSPCLRETALHVIKKMKENGAAVSFDVNYRAALWSEEEARSVIESVLPMVDILFVSEETSRRMFQKTGTLEEIQKSYADEYGCKIVATTRREVVSPTCHNFGSVIYSGGKSYTEEPYKGINVTDRVGSGDAYVGGVLYSLLTSDDISRAVSFGNALSAIKNTIPGDMSPTSLPELCAVIDSHKKTGPQDEMVR